MMKAATMKNFTAADAKARFAELLDLAAAHTIAITNDHQPPVYLMSAATYHGMVKRLEILDDQLWLMKAEENRKGGFASEAHTDALLRRLGDLRDEEANDL